MKKKKKSSMYYTNFYIVDVHWKSRQNIEQEILFIYYYSFPKLCIDFSSDFVFLCNKMCSQANMLQLFRSYKKKLLHSERQRFKFFVS